MTQSEELGDGVRATVLKALASVDVLPPIAYHRGTVAVSFGFRRMLNSMVNARDSRFILVQALDRRSSNDPTSSRRLPFALD